MERLVADAVAVEKEGLRGGVFADSRGFRGTSGYSMGDIWIRRSHDLLAGCDLEMNIWLVLLDDVMCCEPFLDVRSGTIEVKDIRYVPNTKV